MLCLKSVFVLLFCPLLHSLGLQGHLFEVVRYRLFRHNGPHSFLQEMKICNLKFKSIPVTHCIFRQLMSIDKAKLQNWSGLQPHSTLGGNVCKEILDLLLELMFDESINC